MSIKKKTSKWEEAGLLSADQATQIIEYEKNRAASKLFKGLYGTGAFSVLVGILAIVASNWQIIPAETKLIVHLLINVGAAYGVYQFDIHNKRLLRELFIFGFMGLTLTLIALTGQVFHLNGSIASALVLWMVLTTPFVLTFGHTKISLFPWIISFVTAISAVMYEYIYPSLSDTAQLVVSVGIWTMLPVIFVQSSAAVQKLKRPELQNLLFYMGIAGAAIIANICCQLWYVDLEDSLGIQILVLGSFALTAMLISMMRFPTEFTVVQDIKNTRLFLWGSLGASAIPFALPGVESDILGAATFIGYWIFLGYIGQITGRQNLVSLAITVIALRIYVIYLEVFGTLLQSGFGLIFSGLLLMGMVAGIRYTKNVLTIGKLEGDDHE